MCKHINKSHASLFADPATRGVGVNEILTSLAGSRFCDVCLKFFMDTPYGRRWHTDSDKNDCAAVSDLLNQFDNNPGSLPPAAALVEVTRDIPVSVPTDIYTKGKQGSRAEYDPYSRV